MKLIDFLIAEQAIISMSEQRRYVGMGGIKVNGEVITDNVDVKPGDVIEIGKKKKFTVPHLLVCNYPDGPIGGPGCICKREENV